MFNPTVRKFAHSFEQFGHFTINLNNASDRYDLFYVDPYTCVY